MRVVALTCSNTEIVCALGCADLLVGVDDHSDHPADVVGRLPRVGKDLSVDPDAVAALRPDLVLASLTVPGHERVVAGLQARGLPLLVLEPKSVAETCASVRAVGRALGVAARGEALAQEIADAVGPIPAAPPPGAPRVLVEWWPKPVIAAGRRSWVHDLLLAAGADNALGQRDVESAPLHLEDAAGLAPDAVVLSWCGVPVTHYRPDVVYRRAAWAEVPAVRDRRVFPISEAFLGRPGPRLVEGVAALRAVVAACRAPVAVG